MELRFHITSVARLYSMHVYMCWNEVLQQYSFTGGFHSAGRGLVSREQAVSAGPPSDNGALQALLPGVTTMPCGSPQRPDPQLPTLQVRGHIGSGLHAVLCAKLLLSGDVIISHLANRLWTRLWVGRHGKCHTQFLLMREMQPASIIILEAN